MSSVIHRRGTCRVMLGVLGSVLVQIGLAAVSQAAVAPVEWKFVDAPAARVQDPDAWVRPRFFRAVELNIASFDRAMAAAPLEFTGVEEEGRLVIELPDPFGLLQRFEVFESPVMHPDLAAQVPEIRTFSGRGLDDPTATLRMDRTPAGMHAMVLSSEGAWAIDPYWRNNDLVYAVYRKEDLRGQGEDGWACHVASPPGEEDVGDAMRRASSVGRVSGSVLQRYRLAVATTGEYTDFHSPCNPPCASDGLAAAVTVINRVNMIYERDLAVRFELVANNLALISTSAGGDPYDNFDVFSMMTQNQSNIDLVIGNAGYDVGHVFGTFGGGVASLASACRTGLKARGVTGISPPIGDVFAVDYAAHEIGHQFGGNHTFNTALSGCVSQRVGNSAVEPGSGSTIMAYAGICGADNLQPNSDAYFHGLSIDEILDYTDSGNGQCAAMINTGNTPPTVNAGIDRLIPRSTPFVLTATASDVNNDSLTYCWEQLNTNIPSPQSSVGGVFPDVGTNPIIRSFLPSSSPSRTVPRMSDLLAGTSLLGETLPTTNRTLLFQCMVRDNRPGGGGINFDGVNLTVIAAAGPFAVTFPNGGESLFGSTTVTWNPAGTTSNGINVLSVRIELSLDGGQTWPVVLAATTPNDGSHPVTLPSTTSSQARVRISAVGNIFFDISNTNFLVTPGPIPTAFALLTPTNGATDQSLEPMLTWSASSSATSYRVELDADAGFTPPLILEVTTSSLSYPVPAGLLQNLTSYRWRVTAINSFGQRPGDPTFFTFTTAAPPPFCPGDANGDRTVDFPDISSALLNWGNVYQPGSRGPGDADNGGSVDFVDITNILLNWLEACP